MESLVPVLIVAAIIVWVFGRPLLRALGRLGSGGRRGRRYWPLPGSHDVSDAEEQLAFVSAVEFERQPLLNKGEFRVLLVLEKVVRDLRAGHRVMAQTSLGEILRPKDCVRAESAELAFRSINSKRSDFIVVNRRGFAVLAVEYQGTGHHQGNAAHRDAVKRVAFRSAGVALIEVPAEFDGEALAQAVRNVLGEEEGADRARL